MRTFILADNQAITKAGIKYLLTKESISKNIIEVENKRELIEQLLLYPTAIVILDYTLFNINDISELSILEGRFEQAQWVLFSDELSSNFLKQVASECSRVGALSKDSTLDDIETTLLKASKGERTFCQETSSALRSERKTLNGDQPKTEVETLTISEKKILREIASGKTTKEIANELFLSFHTVNSHRKNIFRKLGVNNLHEATKYALRAGRIDMADYCI